MDFEYAAISKKDLTHKMEEFGIGFTIFKCDPLTSQVIGQPLRFVVIDHLQYTDPLYLEKVAVHEYGESLMIGHKEASILEWGVAKIEKILSPYLEWIRNFFPSKICDLNECSLLYRLMPDEVYASAKAKAESNPEAKKVLAIMKDFDFPEEASKILEEFNRSTKMVLADFPRLQSEAYYIVEHSHFPALFASFLARYVFYTKARRTAEDQAETLVAASGELNDRWESLLTDVNKRYLDRFTSLVSALMYKLTSTDNISQDEASELKDEVDRVNTPIKVSLPSHFSFAVRIGNLLKVEQSDADNIKDTIFPYLTKAKKIARLTLKVVEFDEHLSRELTNHEIETMRFYIQCLLFDALVSLNRNGLTSQLKDAKIQSFWKKQIDSISSDFQAKTANRLFTSQEIAIWTNINKLYEFYNEFLTNKNMGSSGTNVLRFSAPTDSPATIRQPKKRIA